MMAKDGLLNSSLNFDRVVEFPQLKGNIGMITCELNHNT